MDTYSRRSCFSRKCDLDVERMANLESEIAQQIAGALKRPLVQRRRLPYAHGTAGILWHMPSLCVGSG